MIAEAFLLCALSAPGVNYPRVQMTMTNNVHRELEQLRAWIHKYEPGAEIRIIQGEANPEQMRKEGWERIPFRYRDREIWIRRKERNDNKMQSSA